MKKLTKTPKVSIGMPVYNGKAYIREALDSLLAQSYSDIELVISDNASTDGTEDICLEYAKSDSRISYIRQPYNIGGAANFNYVLNSAVGEYFMWAACDDCWGQDWIKDLISNIKTSDAGVFGCYVEGDSKESLVPKSFKKGGFSSFFMASDLTGKCYYSYALFKKEILLNSYLDLMNCPVGADQLFLLNILQYGDLRAVNGPIFQYRIHNNSVSSKQSYEYGNLKRLLFSKFPFEYYRLAVSATPTLISQLSIMLLIPIKYFKEQVRNWFMVIKILFTKILKKIKIN